MPRIVTPRIKVMKLNPAAQLPRYAHVGAWGDLAADLYASEAVSLGAGATLAVPTGLAMEFPSTHGALVEDRSGLALKGLTTLAIPTGLAMEFPSTHGALVEDRSGLAMKGLTTLAGVIDPGYRGEIRIVVTNLGTTAFTVNAGDRIAQLRIVQRIEAQFEEVAELAEAPRGAGGFGSTGV
jgi:dUTP pyrophosphatase